MDNTTVKDCNECLNKGFILVINSIDGGSYELCSNCNGINKDTLPLLKDKRVVKKQCFNKPKN
jgi:hypothetical protein